MNLRLGNLKSGTYRKIGREEYEELLYLLEDSTNLSYVDSQELQ